MEPQSEDDNLKVPQLHYATNDNYAEKAQYYTISDVDASESVEKVDSEEDDLAIEFRPDAKIWYLYLEEAEREAKERAELWRTGLDSLLIFAGLFAGVVAGFVIDAKSDLQSDSQQRLLSEILGALQDPPSVPTIQISESSQWISGLWVVSLALTVFSAIGGVLAKAWLAKYVPVTTQRDANYKDALARYRLDQQAEKWHLEEVLTAMPLLVQIASFLFFVGLMIQTNGDNQTIGSALIAFCVAGGLVYFTMTVLPLWSPTSPFNTPLSSLFLWLKIPVVAVLSGSLFGNDSLSAAMTKGINGNGLDDNEALADILYTKLLKSPKSTYVDEAIAEIASPSFKESWVGYLCQKGAPKILLARFREFAATRADATDQQFERIFNHILAILSFVDYHEKLLMGAPIGEQGTLQELRRDFLRSVRKPGNPLHRWNYLPEAIRPLLFGLRGQLLTLMGPADLFPHIDFKPKELEEHPWELAFQEILPGHQLPFTIAACRGLIHGTQNLKTICASMLGISLAKATLAVTRTGYVSEVEGNSSTELEKVEALAVKYLARLYKAIASGWESLPTSALNDLSGFPVTVAEKPDAVAIETRSSVLGSLLPTLSEPNHPFRGHAIKTVKAILSSLDRDSAPTPSAGLLVGVEETFIKGVVDAVVLGGSELHFIWGYLEEKAKSDGALEKLIADNALSSIKSGLSGFEGAAQIRIINFVRIFLQSFIFEAYSDEVRPLVIDLVFNGSGPNVKDAATKLLPIFFYRNSLAVMHAIAKHLELGLGSEQFGRRFDILMRLQKDSDTSDRVLIDQTVLDKISMIAIHEKDDLIRKDVLEELRRIINEANVINRPLNLDVTLWLESDNWEPGAMLKAVEVVGLFMELSQVDLDNTSILQKLIDLAAQNNDNIVRTASLELLSKLFRYYVMHGILSTTMESVKLAIVAAKDRITDERDDSIRRSWITLLTDIAEDGFFPGVIEIITWILNVYHIYKLNDEGFDSEVVELLCSKFIPDEQYHDAILSSIPADLSVALQKTAATEKTREWELKYNQKLVGVRWWSYKVTWVKLLIVMCEQSGLRGRAEGTLSDIREEIRADLGPPPNISEPEPGESEEETNTAATKVYFAESEPSEFLLSALNANSISTYTRVSWVELLGIVAAHFSRDFGDVPAILFHMATHSDTEYEVRVACLKSLVLVAQQSGEGLVRDLIADGINSNLDLLMNVYGLKSSSGFIRVLGPLGTCGNFPHILANLENIITGASNSDWVRSAAIDAMATCATQGIYRDLVVQIITKNNEACMKDMREALRRSWIRFVGSQIRDAEFSGLPPILDAAIKECRWYIHKSTVEVEVLKDLLKDEKLRDSMAAKLAELFNARLRDRTFEEIIPTLSALTKPVEGAFGRELEEHEVWIQIIRSLCRNAELGVSQKLVEKALREPQAGRAFGWLDRVLQGVTDEHAEPIQSILARSINATLYSETNSSETINLFKLLAGSGGRWDAHLGDKYDTEIISRLAKFSVTEKWGSRDGIETAALETLKSVLRTSRYQDHVTTSWSKAIETGLTEEPTRTRAVTVVKLLIAEANDGFMGKDPFTDIVSPSIPQLMSLILVDGVGKEILHVLLTNSTLASYETKLNVAILATIPPLVPVITAEGKGVVLQLIGTLKIYDGAAVSTANTLMLILRNASSSATRATTIEILSSLYSKHAISSPSLIEAAIPEIIAVALEDKDDVGGARTTAIRLLASLSTPRIGLKGSPWYPNPDIRTLSAVKVAMRQITPLAPKFMMLLSVDSLQAAVVELLSAMSVEPSVRRAIVLRIIAVAFATGPGDPSLVGHVKLLVALISDGRLQDEPTDYVAVTLASALVARKQLSQYQYKVVTALWSGYSWKAAIDVETDKNKSLVTWLTFALFGRHTTPHEVKTWLARCQIEDIVPPPAPIPVAE